MTTYITDPTDIQAIRKGEGELNGKQILLISSDMKSATKRVFRALSGDRSLALLVGLGLSVKSTSDQWRKIGLQELKKLVLDKFLLVREQVGEGGRVRMEILSDVPNAFWLPTLMQGRWIDTEVMSWFPVIRQDKVKIISQP